MSNHINFFPYRRTDNDVYRAYQKYFSSINLKEPKKIIKQVFNWLWICGITFEESRYEELKRDIELS